MLKINYLNLFKKTDSLNNKYLKNKPFPHIHIDNFLSDKFFESNTSTSN